NLSEDDSDYRGSEDSNHILGNILDDEGLEDIYDEAPKYVIDCGHRALNFTLGMKYITSPSQFKHAIMKHTIYAGASLRLVRGGRESRREAVCRAKNCRGSI
ncbi:hypothetical protein LINPERPRIM_LOCUS41196, partial [Linum perenne]